MRFDLEKFLAAIDENTLLVPISQVLFRSSYIVDARAIMEQAHRVGAHVVLDVFQATGAIPLDVRGLGVDFAVGGVLKWLCGGPGVAYLYVREDLRAKLRPALTGWLAHRRPFGFETGAMDRREDSFGFLNGTPHIPALYACGPGLDIINKVGSEGDSRKIIAHDRAIAGRGEGARVASEYSGESGGARGHGVGGMSACGRGVPGTGGSEIFWWITGRKRA